MGEPSNLHTKQKLKPSGKARDGDHEALRCSTGKRFSDAPVQSGAFEILGLDVSELNVSGLERAWKLNNRSLVINSVSVGPQGTNVSSSNSNNSF